MGRVRENLIPDTQRSKIGVFVVTDLSSPRESGVVRVNVSENSQKSGKLFPSDVERDDRTSG